MSSEFRIIEARPSEIGNWIIFTFILQAFAVFLLVFSLVRPWISVFFSSISSVTFVSVVITIDVWGNGMLSMYFGLNYSFESFQVGYMFIFGIIDILVLLVYAAVMIYALYEKLSYEKMSFRTFSYVIFSNLLGILVVTSAVAFSLLMTSLPVYGLSGVANLGDLQNLVFSTTNMRIPLSLGEGFWIFVGAGVIMLFNFILLSAIKNRFYKEILEHGV